MALVKINFDPSRRELRQFAGIWLPLFCLLVAAVLWLRFHWATASLAVIGLAAVIAAVGLMRPRWVRWLYVGWMCAAFPLGWVMANLFLAAIFYGVVTPLGLVMRWCGRDPLTRGKDASRSSYWIDRPAEDDDPTRYFRPF